MKALLDLVLTGLHLTTGRMDHTLGMDSGCPSVMEWLPEEAAKARLFELLVSYQLGDNLESGVGHQALLRSNRAFLARILPPLQDSRSGSVQLVRWGQAFGHIHADEPLEAFLPDPSSVESPYIPLGPDNLPLHAIESLVQVLERFTRRDDLCHFYWWNGVLDDQDDRYWHVAEVTLSDFMKSMRSNQGKQVQPTLWWGGRDEEDRLREWAPSWVVFATHDCNSLYVAGRSREILTHLLEAPQLEVLDASEATAID